MLCHGLLTNASVVQERFLWKVTPTLKDVYGDQDEMNEWKMTGKKRRRMGTFVTSN